jgi:hypothetical protein
VAAHLPPELDTQTSAIKLQHKSKKEEQTESSQEARDIPHGGGGIRIVTYRQKPTSSMYEVNITTALPNISRTERQFIEISLNVSVFSPYANYLILAPGS